MLELVLASRNKHKLNEFRSMLQPLGITVVSVSDFSGVPEVEEDGDTFEANAIKKAVEVAERLKLPVLADDSGLEVDALGGAPGVRSARYAGEDASDAANNDKLLLALKEVPNEKRTGRFRCVIAFALPGADGSVEVQTAEGSCPGQIGHESKGDHGFGYDPLFIVPEYNQTFAQLEPEVKNSISHRAKAMANVYSLLRQWKETANDR